MVKTMAEQNGARVGVFICRCGGQIGLSLDMSSLEEHAHAGSDVVAVRTCDYLCHEEGRKMITETIKSERLDRVVVAACSPKLYLETFQESVVQGGLNRNMIDMANIREQVAWVHQKDRAAATSKAEDMMDMAIAKVRYHEPDDRGNISVVNKKRCTGCGICESVCNVNAITLSPDAEYGGKRRANVNAKACVGCGACVSACPTAAMDQTYFSNKQILAQIDTALAPKEDEVSSPKILVFSCNWCSYGSADQAGLKRLDIDPHFRTVRTMCSARVDPEWILKALSMGADGILILSGRPGRCHYDVGNIRTRKRMTLLKMVLKEYGFDENRFQIKFVDADQPEKYAETINEYVQIIKELGPNPIVPTSIVDPKRVELPYLNL
ncbi:MAG: F420-non-reducing hydrogenase iron-sulfur subunit D [Methanomassiliicoccales archaeon PtaU1.Bin124]|nr:MAG: F420-non-reducing hydrogenase iron-sulfur subunit D [Methanomassiliicoccales archaeon PtaU1.Bin124]